MGFLGIMGFYWNRNDGILREWEWWEFMGIGIMGIYGNGNDGILWEWEWWQFMGIKSKTWKQKEQKQQAQDLQVSNQHVMMTVMG